MSALRHAIVDIAEAVMLSDAEIDAQLAILAEQGISPEVAHVFIAAHSAAVMNDTSARGRIADAHPWMNALYALEVHYAAAVVCGRSRGAR